MHRKLWKNLYKEHGQIKYPITAGFDEVVNCRDGLPSSFGNNKPERGGLFVYIPIWEFFVRIIVLYLAVMVALRLMGKREIGQLSVFDFVVSMMIAGLSTVPMEDTKVPLYLPLVAIAVLVLFQVLVAVLELKSHRFRHWVEGEPVMLVERGQIRDRALRQTRYSMDDLLSQLREQGLSSVGDVEFAILENSGKLSVIPRADRRPLTADDIQKAVRPGSIPLPVVIDGEMISKSLTAINRDGDWLRNELGKRGYQELKDVFYASVDGDGHWHIDSKDPPDSSP